MNSRCFLSIVFLGSAILTCTDSFAQVESNRIYLGEGGGAADYSFALEQLPSTASFDDYTGVWFNFEYNPSTFMASIHGVNTLLDEGSDWYFAHEGDLFGTQTIASNKFDPFIELTCDGCGTDFYQIEFSPTLDFVAGLEDGPFDFYLATATGNIPRTTFGWVKLQITQGFFVWNGKPVLYKLEMLDSRVAYNSRGIIVGTSTLIPEPASCTLLFAPIFMLTIARHSRSTCN